MSVVWRELPAGRSEHSRTQQHLATDRPLTTSSLKNRHQHPFPSDDRQIYQDIHQRTQDVCNYCCKNIPLYVQWKYGTSTKTKTYSI